MTAPRPTGSPREAPASASPTADFWRRWPQHQRALLLLGQRFLGERSADAEDAVSTTLLRALQRLPSTPENIANERAWLIRILYNICMDLHRQRRRFTEPALADVPRAPSEPTEAVLPEVMASPEEFLLSHERSLELRAHIQALPPPLRTPLIMRFYLDMSYPDIAAELRLTNCNVRKRIQLAYARLRTTAGINSSSSQSSSQPSGPRVIPARPGTQPNPPG